MLFLWPNSEQAMRLLRRWPCNILWKAGPQALGCQPLAKTLRHHVCGADETKGFKGMQTGIMGILEVTSMDP